MRVGAVILAAGASSRMGIPGSPKALLKLDGRIFIGRLIDLYREFCDPVVVVLGYHAAAIRAALVDARVTFVDNPDPSRGMLSSLQCGLAALPDGLDAFLFTPCDYPAVRGETVAALVNAARGEVRMPRHNGRKGHPVICDWSLRAELLAADPARGTARDVLDRHRSNTCFIDIDDPGTVTDIDTPDDYRQLVATSPGAAS